MRLDLATQRAERAGQPLDLTAKEQALLVFFLRHPGEVLSRTRIYEHVWDERYDGLSNTLEVHVMELRRKLEVARPAADPHAPRPGLPVRRPARARGRSRMSLTTRLSAFFLAALALVLAGFSGDAVPAGAARYLHRQVDERLAAALDTLAAGRRGRAGRPGVGAAGAPPDAGTATPAPDQVRWAVHDGDGRPVDRSRNLAGAGVIDHRLRRMPAAAEATVRRPGRAALAAVLRRRLAAPAADGRRQRAAGRRDAGATRAPARDPGADGRCVAPGPCEARCARWR